MSAVKPGGLAVEVLDSGKPGRGPSRREVVAAGVKLAYAAPMVAASFKLTRHGATAAVCPTGYELIPSDDGTYQCCACDCTTVDVKLDVEKLLCISPKMGDVTDICLTCFGIALSL